MRLHPLSPTSPRYRKTKKSVKTDKKVLSFLVTGNRPCVLLGWLSKEEGRGSFKENDEQEDSDVNSKRESKCGWYAGV